MADPERAASDFSLTAARDEACNQILNDGGHSVGDPLRETLDDGVTSPYGKRATYQQQGNPGSCLDSCP